MPLLLACLSLLVACGEERSRVQEDALQASTAALTEDWNPPVIEVFEPAGYSIVSGTVPLRVQATDDVAVTHMELFIGDQKVAESDSGSIAYAWDSTQVPDGWTWVYLYVTDVAGNTGYRDAQYLVRNLPGDYELPQVQLTVPLDPVTGVVRLSATATDNVGVTHLELHVYGASATAEGSSVEVDVDTAMHTPGESYYIYAVAYDAAGNMGYADGTLTIGTR